jgi:ferredoxin
VSWLVELDAEACLGSGMCVGVAPAHFGFDGSRGRALAPRVEPDDVVLDAAEACPAEAIAVHDPTTGRRLAPAPE